MSYIAFGDPTQSQSPGNAISIGNNARNTVVNSCLIGDPNIKNIRPNNSSICDLGTTDSPFNVMYLKYGQPSSLTKFTMYQQRIVQNTNVEISLTNGATQLKDRKHIHLINQLEWLLE